MLTKPVFSCEIFFKGDLIAFSVGFFFSPRLCALTRRIDSSYLATGKSLMKDVISEMFNNFNHNCCCFLADRKVTTCWKSIDCQISSQKVPKKKRGKSIAGWFSLTQTKELQLPRSRFQASPIQLL